MFFYAEEEICNKIYVVTFNLGRSKNYIPYIICFLKYNDIASGKCIQNIWVIRNRNELYNSKNKNKRKPQYWCNFFPLLKKLQKIKIKEVFKY